MMEAKLVTLDDNKYKTGRKIGFYVREICSSFLFRRRRQLSPIPPRSPGTDRR